MAVSVARPARTFSLRAHLLLLVIGTLVPTLAVMGFLVRRVVSDNREAIERRLLEAAHAEAILVDAELTGTIRALQGLGLSDRLTADDISSFYAQAQELLPMQATWTAVTLSDPAGHQIAHTSRPLGDALATVIDRDTFARAVESKT